MRLHIILLRLSLCADSFHLWHWIRADALSLITSSQPPHEEEQKCLSSYDVDDFIDMMLPRIILRRPSLIS